MSPESTSFFTAPGNLKELVIFIVTGIAGLFAICVAIFTQIIPWCRTRKDRICLAKGLSSDLYLPDVIERSTRYYIEPDGQSIDPAGSEEPRLTLATKQKLKSDKEGKQSETPNGQSRLSWLLRIAIVLFISGMVVPVLMYEKPASGEVNRKEQSLTNTDLVKEAEAPNPKKKAAPLKKEHTDKEEVETAVIPEKKFRSVSTEFLSKESVKAMLNKLNFYCGEIDWSREYCNPYGSGFDNKFEQKISGKVVYDQASGLMWQQSGSDKYLTYDKAMAYIERLNNDHFAGYSDWRLPTLEEAMSLMEPPEIYFDLSRELFFIDQLFDKTQRWIWTSDIHKAASAWMVSFYYGLCSNYYFNNNCYVRAVR